MEFVPFPKIARLNRNTIITEKIDGTNAAIGFTEEGELWAQSRTRIIKPGDDNYGFAGWAYEHARELFCLLGQGVHFGEWWGSGIQRRYGLVNGEKRFSLFNVSRWNVFVDQFEKIPGLGVVPTLYTGPFSQAGIDSALLYLRNHGSVAAPGFMTPEGIVVYHEAAQKLFKVALEKDASPKGLAQ